MSRAGRQALRELGRRRSGTAHAVQLMRRVQYVVVVVIIGHEATATARRTSLFVVRAFVNDTITVTVWTGLHLLLRRIFERSESINLVFPVVGLSRVVTHKLAIGSIGQAVQIVGWRKDEPCRRLIDTIEVPSASPRKQTSSA